MAYKDILVYHDPTAESVERLHQFLDKTAPRVRPE